MRRSFVVKLWTVLFIANSLAAESISPAADLSPPIPDPWLNKQVLLKPDAKAFVGNVPVDPRRINLPAKVTAVEGDWLWLTPGWVKKQDVLTPEQAVAYFNDRIRRQPTAALYRDRGFVHYLNKSLDAAASDLEQAVRLTPQDPMAHTYLGMTLIWQERYSDGLDELTEAVCRDPTYAGGYIIRALLYSRVKHWEAAIRDFTEAIRIDPECALAYASRAEALHGSGKRIEALADYERAIQHDARNAELYYRRAELAHEIGLTQVAIDDCDILLRLDGKNADAAYLRGIARCRQSDYEAAATDFTSVLREGERGDALTMRGVCLALQGQFERGLSDIDRAIELSPREPLYRRARSLVYATQKNWKAALADITRAAEDDPAQKATNSIAATLYLMAGDPSARDGKLALKYALRACEINNFKDWQTVSTLASAYAASGDFDKAVEFQKKVLEMVPSAEHEEQGKRLQRYEYKQVVEFPTDDKPPLPDDEPERWTDATEPVTETIWLSLLKGASHAIH